MMKLIRNEGGIRGWYFNVQIDGEQDIYLHFGTKLFRSTARRGRPDGMMDILIFPDRETGMYTFKISNPKDSKVVDVAGKLGNGAWVQVNGSIWGEKEVGALKTQIKQYMDQKESQLPILEALRKGDLRTYFLSTGESAKEADEEISMITRGSKSKADTEKAIASAAKERAKRILSKLEAIEYDITTAEKGLIRAEEYTYGPKGHVNLFPRYYGDMCIETTPGWTNITIEMIADIPGVAPYRKGEVSPPWPK